MARKAAANVDENAKPPPEEPAIDGDLEIEVPDLPDEPAETGDIAAQPSELAAPPQPEVNPLQQRLDEMEAARKLAEDQAAADRARAMRAEQALHRASQQASQSQQGQFQAQYESVVNAMGALQAELEAATEQQAAAYAEQDFAKVSDLNRKIGLASARLDRFEVLKDQMDTYAEQQKTAPRQQQPQPQQRQLTTEEQLAQSGLPDRAKSWLRARPEYLNDVEKNTKIRELDAQYKYEYGAKNAYGDNYFNWIEEKLGMRSPAPVSSGNGSSPPAATAPHVSAPPSREAPSMSTGKTPSTTKVTLTREQREVARTIAISRNISQQEAEREYARQLLEMNKRKANGSIS